MKPFSFSGTLPSSKSILNRALIALSYDPDLKVIGDSGCDDVQLMQKGLAHLFSGQPVECRHAGAVLRFLALRASRLPGQHILTGSERLFSRPQEELLPIMGQLGVEATLTSHSLKIHSRGWRLAVDGLQINAQRSSQFASAVVLNAWELKFPLHFHIPRRMVSEGYFRMTLQMVRQLGMRIEDNGSEFFIPANQKIVVKEYRAEIDVSSAFAVAAIAVVAGEARIQNFPNYSLQPDIIFVRLLQEMGAAVQLGSGELVVNKTQKLRGIKANLESSPDLFPILAVLCAMAETPSEIEGIGHLKYKESSRLDRTIVLLQILGSQIEAQEGSVRIHPAPVRPHFDSSVLFDVDQDHRMAMAATVARWAGYPIHVSDMKVVSKSFPEFLALTEGAP